MTLNPLFRKLYLCSFAPSLVTEFIGALDQSLAIIKSSARLTARQKTGLVMILVGIIVTETLNWAAFERRSAGKGKPSQLRWIFYNAKISWHLLLQASIKKIVATYQITSGTRVIDDTGKKLTKRTSKIPGTHKVKATGGYYNGQELVFMTLVTETVTLPVDFRFYTPDPEMSAWRKQNKVLKVQGIPARERPAKPAPDHDNFPTLQALSLDMIRSFVSGFPALRIRAVLADALYGRVSLSIRPQR